MKRQLIVCVAVALAGGSAASAQTATRGGPFVPSRGPVPYPGVYAPGFYGGPVLGTYGGPAGAAEFVAGYRSGSAIAPGGGAITLPAQVQVPQRVYHPQTFAYQPPRPADAAAPTGPVAPPTPGNPGPPRTLSSAGAQPGGGTPGGGAPQGRAPQGPAPGTAAPGTTAPGTTSPAPSAGARFTVTVPADAKLWVNDVETKQSGGTRRFHTPANLEAGRSYEYTFRVQWGEAGQIVTRDRTVQFKPGDDVPVDFTQAAGR
jgi:uncharacterized protein (TIGR03000 family)